MTDPPDTPVPAPVLPPGAGTGPHQDWCDQHDLPGSMCRYCTDPAALTELAELLDD